MKQLTMFIALNTDGGDRLTCFYDVIDSETGSVVESQKREHFFVLDEVLRVNINAIRAYIRERLENSLYLLTSFMVLHADAAYRISFTYDKVSPQGQIISSNNNDGFVVLDEELQSHVTAIWEWIREYKLSE